MVVSFNAANTGYVAPNPDHKSPSGAPNKPRPNPASAATQPISGKPPITSISPKLDPVELKEAVAGFIHATNIKENTNNTGYKLPEIPDDVVKKGSKTLADYCRNEIVMKNKDQWKNFDFWFSLVHVFSNDLPLFCEMLNYVPTGDAKLATSMTRMNELYKNFETLQKRVSYLNSQEAWLKEISAVSDLIQKVNSWNAANQDSSLADQKNTFVQLIQALAAQPNPTEWDKTIISFYNDHLKNDFTSVVNGIVVVLNDRMKIHQPYRDELIQVAQKQKVLAAEFEKATKERTDLMKVSTDSFMQGLSTYLDFIHDTQLLKKSALPSTAHDPIVFYSLESDALNYWHVKQEWDANQIVEGFIAGEVAKIIQQLEERYKAKNQSISKDEKRQIEEQAKTAIATLQEKLNLFISQEKDFFNFRKISNKDGSFRSVFSFKPDVTLASLEKKYVEKKLQPQVSNLVTSVFKMVAPEELQPLMNRFGLLHTGDGVDPSKPRVALNVHNLYGNFRGSLRLSAQEAEGLKDIKGVPKDNVDYFEHQMGNAERLLIRDKNTSLVCCIIISQKLLMDVENAIIKKYLHTGMTFKEFVQNHPLFHRLEQQCNPDSDAKIDTYAVLRYKMKSEKQINFDLIDAFLGKKMATDDPKTIAEFLKCIRLFDEDSFWNANRETIIGFKKDLKLSSHLLSVTDKTVVAETVFRENPFQRLSFDLKRAQTDVHEGSLVITDHVSVKTISQWQDLIHRENFRAIHIQRKKEGRALSPSIRLFQKIYREISLGKVTMTADENALFLKLIDHPQLTHTFNHFKRLKPATSSPTGDVTYAFNGNRFSVCFNSFLLLFSTAQESVECGLEVKYLCEKIKEIENPSKGHLKPDWFHSHYSVADTQSRPSKAMLENRPLSAPEQKLWLEGSLGDILKKLIVEQRDDQYFFKKDVVGRTFETLRDYRDDKGKPLFSDEKIVDLKRLWYKKMPLSEAAKNVKDTFLFTYTKSDTFPTWLDTYSKNLPEKLPFPIPMFFAFSDVQTFVQEHKSLLTEADQQLLAQKKLTSIEEQYLATQYNLRLSAILEDYYASESNQLSTTSEIQRKPGFWQDRFRATQNALSTAPSEIEPQALTDVHFLEQITKLKMLYWIDVIKNKGSDLKKIEESIGLLRGALEKLKSGKIFPKVFEQVDGWLKKTGVSPILCKEEEQANNIIDNSLNLLSQMDSGFIRWIHEKIMTDTHKGALKNRFGLHVSEILTGTSSKFVDSTAQVHRVSEINSLIVQGISELDDPKKNSGDLTTLELQDGDTKNIKAMKTALKTVFSETDFSAIENAFAIPEKWEDLSGIFEGILMGSRGVLRDHSVVDAATSLPFINQLSDEGKAAAKGIEQKVAAPPVAIDHVFSRIRNNTTDPKQSNIVAMAQLSLKTGQLNDAAVEILVRNILYHVQQAKISSDDKAKIVEMLRLWPLYRSKNSTEGYEFSAKAIRDNEKQFYISTLLELQDFVRNPPRNLTQICVADQPSGKGMEMSLSGVPTSDFNLKNGGKIVLEKGVDFLAWWSGTTAYKNLSAQKHDLSWETPLDLVTTILGQHVAFLKAGWDIRVGFPVGQLMDSWSLPNAQMQQLLMHKVDKMLELKQLEKPLNDSSFNMDKLAHVSGQFVDMGVNMFTFSANVSRFAVTLGIPQDIKNVIESVKSVGSLEEFMKNVDWASLLMLCVKLGFLSNLASPRSGQSKWDSWAGKTLTPDRLIPRVLNWVMKMAEMTFGKGSPPKWMLEWEKKGGIGAAWDNAVVPGAGKTKDGMEWILEHLAESDNAQKLESKLAEFKKTVASSDFVARIGKNEFLRDVSENLTDIKNWAKNSLPTEEGVEQAKKTNRVKGFLFENMYQFCTDISSLAKYYKESPGKVNPVGRWKEWLAEQVKEMPPMQRNLLFNELRDLIFGENGKIQSIVGKDDSNQGLKSPDQTQTRNVVQSTEALTNWILEKTGKALHWLSPQDRARWLMRTMAKMMARTSLVGRSAVSVTAFSSLCRVLGRNKEGWRKGDLAPMWKAQFQYEQQHELSDPVSQVNANAKRLELSGTPDGEVVCSNAESYQNVREKGADLIDGLEKDFDKPQNNSTENVKLSRCKLSPEIIAGELGKGLTDGQKNYDAYNQAGWLTEDGFLNEEGMKKLPNLTKRLKAYYLPISIEDASTGKIRTRYLPVKAINFGNVHGNLYAEHVYTVNLGGNSPANYAITVHQLDTGGDYDHIEINLPDAALIDPKLLEKCQKDIAEQCRTLKTRYVLRSPSDRVKRVDLDQLKVEENTVEPKSKTVAVAQVEVETNADVNEWLKPLAELKSRGVNLDIFKFVLNHTLTRKDVDELIYFLDANSELKKSAILQSSTFYQNYFLTQVKQVKENVVEDREIEELMTRVARKIADLGTVSKQGEPLAINANTLNENLTKEINSLSPENQKYIRDNIALSLEGELFGRQVYRNVLVELGKIAETNDSLNLAGNAELKAKFDGLFHQINKGTAVSEKELAGMLVEVLNPQRLGENGVKIIDKFHKEQLKNLPIEFAKLQQDGKPVDITTIPHALRCQALTNSALGWYLSQAKAAKPAFEFPFIGQIQAAYYATKYPNIALNANAGSGKTKVQVLINCFRLLCGQHIMNGVATHKDLSALVRDVGAIYDEQRVKLGVFNLKDTEEKKKKAFEKGLVVGVFDEFRFQQLYDYQPGARAILPENMMEIWTLVLDEADKLLAMDGATPAQLSISSGKQHPLHAEIEKAWQVMEAFAEQVKSNPNQYVNTNEAENHASLTEAGVVKFKNIMTLQGITEGSAVYNRVLNSQSVLLRAHYLLKQGSDYREAGGKIILIDRSTGRDKKGSQLEYALHNILEAKAKLKVTKPEFPSMSLTTINFIKKFHDKILLSGTALEWRDIFGAWGIMTVFCRDQTASKLKGAPLLIVPNDFVKDELTVKSILKEMVNDGNTSLVHIDAVSSTDPTKMTIESLKASLDRVIDYLEMKAMEPDIDVLSPKQKDRLTKLNKQFENSPSEEKYIKNLITELGGDPFINRYRNKVLKFNKMMAEDKRFNKDGMHYDEYRIDVATIKSDTDLHMEDKLTGRMGCGRIGVVLSCVTNRAVDVLFKGLAIKDHFDEFLALRRKFGYANNGLVGIVTEYKSHISLVMQEIFRMARSSGLSREEGKIITIQSLTDMAKKMGPDFIQFIKNMQFNRADWLKEYVNSTDMAVDKKAKLCQMIEANRALINGELDKMKKKPHSSSELFAMEEKVMKEMMSEIPADQQNDFKTHFNMPLCTLFGGMFAGGSYSAPDNAAANFKLSDIDNIEAMLKTYIENREGSSSKIGLERQLNQLKNSLFAQKEQQQLTMTKKDYQKMKNVFEATLNSEATQGLEFLKQHLLSAGEKDTYQLTKSFISDLNAASLSNDCKLKLLWVYDTVQAKKPIKHRVVEMRDEESNLKIVDTQDYIFELTFEEMRDQLQKYGATEADAADIMETVKRFEAAMHLKLLCNLSDTQTVLFLNYGAMTKEEIEEKKKNSNNDPRIVQDMKDMEAMLPLISKNAVDFGQRLRKHVDSTYKDGINGQNKSQEYTNKLSESLQHVLGLGIRRRFSLSPEQRQNLNGNKPDPSLKRTNTITDMNSVPELMANIYSEIIERSVEEFIQQEKKKSSHTQFTENSLFTDQKVTERLIDFIKSKTGLTLVVPEKVESVVVFKESLFRSLLALTRDMTSVTAQDEIIKQLRKIVQDMTQEGSQSSENLKAHELQKTGTGSVVPLLQNHIDDSSFPRLAELFVKGYKKLGYKRQKIDGNLVTEGFNLRFSRDPKHLIFTQPGNISISRASLPFKSFPLADTVYDRVKTLGKNQSTDSTITFGNNTYDLHDPTTLEALNQKLFETTHIPSGDPDGKKTGLMVFVVEQGGKHTYVFGEVSVQENHTGERLIVITNEYYQNNNTVLGFTHSTKTSYAGKTPMNEMVIRLDMAKAQIKSIAKLAFDGGAENVPGHEFATTFFKQFGIQTKDQYDRALKNLESGIVEKNLYKAIMVYSDAVKAHEQGHIHDFGKQSSAKLSSLIGIYPEIVDRLTEMKADFGKNGWLHQIVNDLHPQNLNRNPSEAKAKLMAYLFMNRENKEFAEQFLPLFEGALGKNDGILVKNQQGEIEVDVNKLGALQQRMAAKLTEVSTNILSAHDAFQKNPIDNVMGRIQEIMAGVNRYIKITLPQDVKNQGTISYVPVVNQQSLKQNSLSQQGNTPQQHLVPMSGEAVQLVSPHAMPGIPSILTKERGYESVMVDLMEKVMSNPYQQVCIESPFRLNIKFTEAEAVELSAALDAVRVAKSSPGSEAESESSPQVKQAEARLNKAYEAVMKRTQKQFAAIDIRHQLPKEALEPLIEKAVTERAPITDLNQVHASYRPLFTMEGKAHEVYDAVSQAHMQPLFNSQKFLSRYIDSWKMAEMNGTRSGKFRTGTYKVAAGAVTGLVIDGLVGMGELILTRQFSWEKVLEKGGHGMVGWTSFETKTALFTYIGGIPAGHWATAAVMIPDTLSQLATLDEDTLKQMVLDNWINSQLQLVEEEAYKNYLEKQVIAGGKTVTPEEKKKQLMVEKAKLDIRCKQEAMIAMFQKQGISVDDVTHTDVYRSAELPTQLALLQQKLESVVKPKDQKMVLEQLKQQTAFLQFKVVFNLSPKITSMEQAVNEVKMQIVKREEHSLQFTAHLNEIKECRILASEKLGQKLGDSGLGQNVFDLLKQREIVDSNGQPNFRLLQKPEMLQEALAKVFSTLTLSELQQKEITDIICKAFSIQSALRQFQAANNMTGGKVLTDSVLSFVAFIKASELMGSMLQTAPRWVGHLGPLFAGAMAATLYSALPIKEALAGLYATSKQRPLTEGETQRIRQLEENLVGKVAKIVGQVGTLMPSSWGGPSVNHVIDKIFVMLEIPHPELVKKLEEAVVSGMLNAGFIWGVKKAAQEYKLAEKVFSIDEKLCQMFSKMELLEKLPKPLQEAIQRSIASPRFKEFIKMMVKINPKMIEPLEKLFSGSPAFVRNSVRFLSWAYALFFAFDIYVHWDQLKAGDYKAADEMAENIFSMLGGLAGSFIFDIPATLTSFIGQFLLQMNVSDSEVSFAAVIEKAWSETDKMPADAFLRTTARKYNEIAREMVSDTDMIDQMVRFAP